MIHVLAFKSHRTVYMTKYSEIKIQKYKYFSAANLFRI